MFNHLQMELLKQVIMIIIMQVKSFFEMMLHNKILHTFEIEIIIIIFIELVK